MTQPTVLVSGTGIAGPSLAFWLTRGGNRVIVVQIAPRIRPSGYSAADPPIAAKLSFTTADSNDLPRYAPSLRWQQRHEFISTGSASFAHCPVNVTLDRADGQTQPLSDCPAG
jgi:hypothetical protein